MNFGKITYHGTDDFPSFTMNDKTITTSNPNKLRVSGIQINKNSAIRRMEFKTNDLANICEIYAINYKFDALIYFSHSNDKEISKIINNYISKNELSKEEVIDASAETDGTTIIYRCVK